MESVSYTHLENYYYRNRRRSEDRNDRNKEQPHGNRQPINHVRTEGYNRNPNNRRFQGRHKNFNNDRNYDRRYGRDNDNRRQWNDNGEVYQRSRSWDRRRETPSGNQNTNEQVQQTNSDVNRENERPE